MEVGSDSSSSWISATNWVVSHGSLNNSISFETPFSEYIQEESNTRKDQLQLVNPPSPNSGPCEITISFSQRHEIQQVYVRSTARVYEIYYAPDEKSSNEYLCTVRCSAATEGDSTLHASDTEEGSTGTMEIPAEKIKNSSSNGTNEDDWVEVKAPGFPFPASSMSNKINRNTERTVQDLYEATAEITDADPCISITLRLLSLQMPGSVHIEEIYIFGEPVEPSDSEHQVGPPENSAGSSLMAMLVPTLLQLSKTRGSTQEKNASDTSESLKYKDGKSKETESLNPKIGITKQQEVQPSIPNGAEKMDKMTKDNAYLTQLESGKQTPRTGQEPDFVNKENDQYFSRIERVLDHLVARVVRLEAFCLRFEEKMLEPISNIETKLGRLEKQLEVLTTRSQISEFNPGTRITAPEFSCSDSLSSSLYNDGNNTGTRIAAPEFSCNDSLANSLCNDENDEHFPKGSEYASKDAPCTRTRGAEILGNESESNSFNNDGINDHKSGGSESANKDVNVGESSSQFCPGLVVRAPEFLSDNDAEGGENDDCDDNNCTDVSESAETTSSVVKPSLSIEAALASALVGFLSTTSVQPSEFIQNLDVSTPDFANEAHSKSPSAIPCDQAADSDSASCFSRENELQVMKLTNESPDETAIYEDWFMDSITETSSEKRPQLEMQYFSENNYDETSGTITLHDLTTAAEVQNKEHKKSDLKTVLERTYSSFVDFELPILDVTFVPQENCIANSPLEALLDDKTEINKDSCVNDDATDGVISVERSSPTPDDQLLMVGIEDLTAKTAVPNEGTECVEDSSAYIGDESFSGLI